jgi:hypothetical protein
MATMTYTDAYWDALGKMLVEREGLDVNKVSREWQAEGMGGGDVFVSLHIPVRIPRAEWDALTAAAAAEAWDQVK